MARSSRNRTKRAILNIRAWHCVRGKPPIDVIGRFRVRDEELTSFLENRAKHKHHEGECNPQCQTYGS